jgi:HEAT repeat protein
MIKALETEQSNHIVTGAMVALAKIGDVKSESGKSEFAEKFKPFLASKNAEIAETAAVSLGILANDSPEIIDLLARLLSNDNAKLRDTCTVRMAATSPCASAPSPPTAWA